jgi:hypothetical protein
MDVSCSVATPEEPPMRFVGISLTAIGLSSLLLSAVVATAVLAPVPHQAKALIGEWTTTVSKD